MKVVWARVLVLSILVMGTMVLSAIAVSTNASAAAVDGTWDSRIAGEGYTQTYPDPDGNIVTDSSDAKLVVSSSGSAVTGTLTIVSGSYDVTGTFDGTTFVMRLFWGWDGVTYCEGVYTLTVDGDRMYGSGSYLNVGYTINGYFDLQKGGVFAVGGITPVVSGVTISLAIFSIIIAVMPAAGAPADGLQASSAHPCPVATVQVHAVSAVDDRCTRPADVRGRDGVHGGRGPAIRDAPACRTPVLAQGPLHERVPGAAEMPVPQRRGAHASLFQDGRDRPWLVVLSHVQGIPVGEELR